MTAIMYHYSRKVDKNHTRHSCLIDIGDDIEVRQIMEYKWKIFDSVVLQPPHPMTRFFELVMVEYHDSRSSLIDDLHIFPVRARQKPDFTILGIPVKKGKWEIIERIYRKTNTTEIQWIYTDDFHLFAITHATEYPDTIIDEIVRKIDDIASSIRSGYRIPSHMENRRRQREAFDSVTDSPDGIILPTTAPIRHPEFPLVADLGDGDRKKIQDEILRDLVALGSTLDTFGGSNRNTAKIEISEKTDINRQLAHIEELQDLEWLFE